MDCFHLPWISSSRISDTKHLLKPTSLPNPSHLLVHSALSDLRMVFYICTPPWPGDSVPYCGEFWIMSTGQRDFTIQKTYWGNVITQAHFQQGKRGCLGPSITQEQRWREQRCDPIRLGWVVLLPSISVGVPGLAKYQIPGEHLMVG